MYKIKLQFLGVALLYLTETGVNMESCNSLDLRAIAVHMRQTQTDFKKLQDMHVTDIANLRQELNNSASASKNKIEVVEGKINNTETVTKNHLNSLQEQINKSRADQKSQQYLIETLEEHSAVLQEQLNKSDSKISELNVLMNVSKTELKSEVKSLYDELAERLRTSVEELNVTFQETKEQLETLQNDFKREMNRIDGQWSIWSGWSACPSTSCRKTRTRTCNNPAPSAYGHMCEGNSMDVDICDLTFCKSALSVRLADGTSRSGRLEVSVDGINWGTVCDDGFDSFDARVACRMLGYPGSGVIPYTNITDGTGPIFLDDLGCVGTESSLLHCYYSGWGTHNCGHSEDVGVSC